MDLAKNDMRIEILKKVLDERNKFLADKHKEIQQSSKENKFLVDVAEDYSKYYKAMKKQKLEQRDALEVLNKYINDTAITLRHSKEILSHNKIQQEEIVTQIDRLRKEMDEII